MRHLSICFLLVLSFAQVTPSFAGPRRACDQVFKSRLLVLRSDLRVRSGLARESVQTQESVTSQEGLRVPKSGLERKVQKSVRDFLFRQSVALGHPVLLNRIIELYAGELIYQGVYTGSTPLFDDPSFGKFQKVLLKHFRRKPATFGSKELQNFVSQLVEDVLHAEVGGGEGKSPTRLVGPSGLIVPDSDFQAYAEGHSELVRAFLEDDLMYLIPRMYLRFDDLSLAYQERPGLPVGAKKLGFANIDPFDLLMSKVVYYFGGAVALGWLVLNPDSVDVIWPLLNDGAAYGERRPYEDYIMDGDMEGLARAQSYIQTKFYEFYALVGLKTTFDVWFHRFVRRHFFRTRRFFNKLLRAAPVRPRSDSTGGADSRTTLVQSLDRMEAHLDHLLQLQPTSLDWSQDVDLMSEIHQHFLSGIGEAVHQRQAMTDMAQQLTRQKKRFDQKLQQFNQTNTRASLAAEEIGEELESLLRQLTILNEVSLESNHLYQGFVQLGEGLRQHLEGQDGRVGASERSLVSVFERHESTYHLHLTVADQVHEASANLLTALKKQESQFNRARLEGGTR